MTENNKRAMSNPNDKQKCGTCHGLTWVTVENSFYPRTKPCTDCAAGEGEK